jgi:hypothetical protein
MIKFFRKIRQKLLSENRFSKYFIYAIGEILLVVIGILIALSINNWNEFKKERITERDFLISIQNDLKQDTAFLSSQIKNNKYRLSRYHFINPKFQLEDEYKVEVKDTAYQLRQFTSSPRTFGPTTGAYNSLISEGKTSLITNKELLKKIQEIYEVEFRSNELITKRREEILLQLHWERRLEIDRNPYLYPNDIKDELFLAELNYNKRYVHFYLRQKIRYKTMMTELIVLIDEELKDD